MSKFSWLTRSSFTLVDSNAFLLGGCSSLGQGLLTSTYVGEIMVAIVIATLGLVLFALLIGNMQVIKACMTQLLPVFYPLLECNTHNRS